MVKDELKLKGFTFQELFTPAGLGRLDNDFLAYLKALDEPLHGDILNYRAGLLNEPKAVSDFIIEAAPIVEAFLAELFGIKEEVGLLAANIRAQDPIFNFKKQYVLREARRATKLSAQFPAFQELDAWVSQQLKILNLDDRDRELAVAYFAEKITAEQNREAQDNLIAWCVQALETEAGQQAVKGWVSFHLPYHLNYANLVSVERVPDDDLERLQGLAERWRHREGFKLTDHRMNLREVLDHVHYCVYCHKTDGDFCSKGFPVKKNAPEQGLKTNPLQEILTGCPLEEKISEMHFLKSMGFNIGALATVMIDNPMCPATGHRICNDCMKACIYQKQEPVNIPQIETRVLTDILSLPWGVEIYDLLTRWNPLRNQQWLPHAYNGKKILVMGMGPAGFTLAHHLLMEGFAVVGMDGLKIEPLACEYKQPIFSYDEIKENLDNRVMAGFGGVAEYGITVRWDKNFLKLIYITLMRRPYFQVYGSVRFGGTVTVEDAWALGFDHLAIAVGAGLPRELKIPHSLAPGMRQANDFLMALQLTGAAKFSSLANLQVRLPAVIIGGGLTGIDTATEVQAYYIAQVEKAHYRYKILSAHFGESELRARFDCHSLEILDEYLQHAEIIQHERALAKQENRHPNFIELIRQFGGVTVAYRRSMQESPAYRRNHEEVEKAFEEGIYYAEGLEPIAVVLDEKGFVNGLKCCVRIINEEGEWMDSDAIRIMPAKSIFVATGAKPNIAYEYENRGTFKREGDNYQRFEDIDDQLEKVDELNNVKAPPFGPFTSYQNDNKRISFLGDTHPVFHGSVVKAISSAKQMYPFITHATLKQPQLGKDEEYRYFRKQMEGLFQATVVSVERHRDDLLELIVRAPMAARNFRPGQFYRIQNYEVDAPKLGETSLQTEAMAMLASKHSQDFDNLSFLVMERGTSTRLVATFRPGQALAIMGPTGVRSKVTTDNETVMIIGGTMAMAQAHSLGPALRAAGNRVVFVACMDDHNGFYNQQALAHSTDAILWVSAQGEAIKPMREQDASTCGELIEALRSYALGDLHTLGKPPIHLQDIDRVVVVGSSDLIRRVTEARKGLLHEFFRPDTQFVASVYGPMQCMLKGVCAQCLQWQIDPITGERTKAVYACSWQEQPMELIDINNIDERLQQNGAQEVLTDAWLDYLFKKYDIIKI